MRRVLLAIALAVLVTSQLAATALATSPGGWNHLGHGSTASIPALNGPVDALNTSAPGVLYVGGGFSDAGGVAAADRIARWSGSSWSAIGPIPLDNGTVNAIAYHSGKIYIGGTFLNAGGVGNADYLAEWNGTAWVQPCGGDPMNGTVAALQIIGNTLYVGGAFQNGSGSSAVNFLFGCDLTTGAIKRLVANHSDINSGIYALAADSNGVLYAGGTFINMAGVIGADHFAAYDGTWHSPGGVSQVVRSLTTVGTNVYVGSDAENIGGIAQADHVARWDGSSWHALGSDTAGTSGWFNSFAFIDGMTTWGALVFATGSFVNANGQPSADNIAYFDGSTWHPLGSNGAGNGPLTQNGLALAIFSSNVVVGGVFQAGSDPIAQNIAGYPLYRPDNRIGVHASGPFIGNDVYNATGSGQTDTLSVAHGHRGTFYIDTQNDGLGSAAFIVRALGSAKGYTVRFYKGTKNVTTKVLNGTYQTASLAPGANLTLKMVVKVATSSAKSATFRVMAETTGITAQDVVMAEIKAK